jgi:hypothetical protein
MTGSRAAISTAIGTPPPRLSPGEQPPSSDGGVPPPVCGDRLHLDSDALVVRHDDHALPQSLLRQARVTVEAAYGARNVKRDRLTPLDFRVRLAREGQHCPPTPL